MIYKISGIEKRQIENLADVYFALHDIYIQAWYNYADTFLIWFYKQYHLIN